RYRPFAEARAFVHARGLKNQEDWKTYCLSGNKPADIPNQPREVYSSEWQGMGDWLGTGVVATSRRRYRPFGEAREFMHALRLKNEKQWKIYRLSGNKPNDIPNQPRGVYSSE